MNPAATTSDLLPAGDRERIRARRGWLPLRLALIGGLIAGAVSGLEALRSPERFPVNAVRIDGELVRVRESDLYPVLAPLVERGFWQLDMAAVREAVEALPWVRSASVRRVWPDQLAVALQEHEALAYWNTEALVTAEGHVLRPPADTWPERLPRLHSNVGQAEMVVDRFLDWQARLADVGVGVVSLQLDDRRSWSLQLDTGTEVRLGRFDVERRLDRFIDAVAMIARVTDSELESADLRYPNGLAIRWKADGQEMN